MKIFLFLGLSLLAGCATFHAQDTLKNTCQKNSVLFTDLSAPMMISTFMLPDGRLCP